MRILVIEPDKLLAEQYCQSLGSLGTCHVAGDAQSAISAVDETSPDVIVLELLLGAHNGVEFLHELRSYGDLQDIPVVLHTYVDPGQFTSDEAVLSELGIAAYLRKPEASLAQLVSTVRSVTNPVRS
ncbi:MAG: response regulator [Candidatus Saccharibacteria bacterium]|nr:response regulator [Candidatus Saccharibacteria bacterium]